jgi:hypothetical protein
MCARDPLEYRYNFGSKASSWSQDAPYDCNVGIVEDALYKVYHLKRNPTRITYYGTKMKSEAGPPRILCSPNLLHDTRIKVTLVARPLLTPVAQKLYRCAHGIFTRTYFCGNFSKKEFFLIIYDASRNWNNIEQTVANIVLETLRKVSWNTQKAVL